MRLLPVFLLSVLSSGISAQSNQDSAFAHAILEAHNAYRASVQIADLKWSSQLALDAKVWAEHLAKANKGAHDASIRGREGENIWWGTAGAYSVTDMVSFWGNEKKDFVYSTFPNCKKGNAVVGHYTQMVWKNTTMVGCAVATNGKMDYLVCRYSPPGNIIGQPPY